MSGGLSLDTIKQKYNLPQNATTAEIIKFANDNAIVIDFSGKNQETKDLNKPQNEPVNTPKSDNAQVQKSKFSFNIDFSSSASNKANNTSLSNNNSLFGFGNASQDDDFFGFKPTLTQPAAQNAAVSGQIKSPEETKAESKDNNTETETKTGTFKFDFSFLDKLSDSQFGNLLSSAQKENDQKHAKSIAKIDYTDDGKLIKTLADGSKVEEELSEKAIKQREALSSDKKVVSREFVDGKMVITYADGHTDERTRKQGSMENVVDVTYTNDGKVIKTLTDGSKVEEKLPPEISAVRDKQSESERILNRKCENGKVTETFADGHTETRDAKFGEHGYVKDGNSVEEEIESTLGVKFNELNGKEKQEAVNKYVKTVFKKLSPEERQAKFNELLKNTDGSSETGRQLSAMARHMKGKQDKKVAQNTVIQSRESEAAKLETAKLAAADIATEEVDDPAEQAENLAVIGEVGREQGVGSAVSETIVDNFEKISDVNSEVAATVALETDSETAKTKFNEKLDNNKDNEKTLNDNQLKGINNASVDHILKSGDSSDEIASIVGKSTRLLSTAEDQIAETQRTHEALQNAKQDARQAILREQGAHGHEYLEDAQLEADRIAREYDDEDAYNISAADNLQNYKNEYIQKELSQRTIDSGNEAALNAMARHVYEYNESNRDSIIEQLKNSGYDSVQNTLDQAKADYEANLDKTEDINVNSSESADSEQVSSIASGNNSAERINNIVNNNNMNTTQKAKEIRNLSPKEQKEVISQLLEKATIPEIKGYILSGFKTEVINYLLDNYSSQNSSILKELTPIMSPYEKERFDMLTETFGSNVQKKNFFIN